MIEWILNTSSALIDKAKCYLGHHMMITTITTVDEIRPDPLGVGIVCKVRSSKKVCHRCQKETE